MKTAISKELIAAAQAGDSAAWKALIEASQGRLFRFCLVMCGDAGKAEDLCQEAYIKTFSSLSKLTKPESFYDWLFRVTRHLYIDQLRATKETPAEIADDSSHSPDHAEALSVHQVLSQFEPEDRWLLTLIDMEDYSYREAAELMGISEDSVRSRLFRLRKKFLEKWQDRETK